MESRLRQALARAEEVATLLADPNVAQDPAKLKALGREHTRLRPVVETSKRLGRLREELEQAREMAQEADPELVALAQAEVQGLTIDAIYSGDEESASLSTRIFGRVSCERVTDPVTKEIIVDVNDLITEERGNRIEDIGHERLKIRSALTCESKRTRNKDLFAIPEELRPELERAIRDFRVATLGTATLRD